MAGIRKKFSFQLLYALSQLIFPLISYPYITRTIGAKGLGKVGYIDSVTGFIITIVAFGIPYYGVREVARLQEVSQKREQLFRQLFTIHFLASIIGLLVFVALIAINQNQDISPALFFLGGINILLPPFVAEWYLQGMEAFQFTTVRSILLRLAGLIAMLLLIHSPDDYLIYFSIIVFVQLAVALTNLSKIGYRNIAFELSGWKEHTRSLWRFFLTASIISIYVFFDVIILGWFASEEAVGYYSVAIRVVKLSLLLVLSLNVILFPRISNLISSNDLKSIGELLGKAMQFIILLTFPIAAGFYFLAPQIIHLLAGDKFTPSIYLVQLLSTLPFIIGVSNLFVYQILIPFGKERKLLLSVFITSLCSLAFHLVLVYSFKEKGTAMATLLTESCMSLLVFYFSAKTFAFSFPVKTLFQSAVALLPLIFLILLCQQKLENRFAIVICSVIPGMLLYGWMQIFLFKNELVRETYLSLRWHRKLTVSNG